MKSRDSCDAAMFPGAYKQTLQFAAETFPEWFLEDRYISEITDPETGRITAPYVVPFRDWAVSLTQETLLDARGDHTADDLARIADRLISRFRVERAEIAAEREAARQVADEREAAGDVVRYRPDEGGGQ